MSRSSPKSKKKFLKYPDAPLGEVIASKHNRRKAEGMGRKKKRPSR